MPKLLLADDSPTTQKVVQLTFADEGIDVVIADDGDTAMEMFDHHHPDIVLADINIPGLNGYEVCEAIRKRESNGKTPVVLLAGSFEPFDVEAAHRVGANDYLTKPFSSIRRLVATVTALLDSAVKADEETHDTVEPEDDRPAPEQQIEAFENQPAPGTKQPEAEEPDMFSTSDIESLYTQSVSEPSDASSRIQESYPTDEPESATEEATLSARDDSAFDDELIETTYVASDAEEAQQTAPADEPEIEEPEVEEPHVEEPQPEGQPIENLSAPQIPVPMDELPPEDVPQSQIPTVRFRTPMEENIADREVRPSEEFRSRSFTGNTIETIRPISFERIDQTNDAAYFEPAVEQSQPVEEIEQPESSTVEQPSEEIKEESVPPEQQSERHVSYGVPDFDIGESQESPESNEASEHEQQSEELSQEAPQPEPSTPWDSYAQPKPHTFQLDDANLLELPAGGDSEATRQTERTDASTSSAAYELAPEIVDQIAKLTATHISEEMIREIAKRVVPKVIEEVMTGRQDDVPQVDDSDTTS